LGRQQMLPKIQAMCRTLESKRKTNKQINQWRKPGISVILPLPVITHSPQPLAKFQNGLPHLWPLPTPASFPSGCSPPSLHTVGLGS
jgi:hypothetical protein